MASIQLDSAPLVRHRTRRPAPQAALLSERVNGAGMVQMLELGHPHLEPVLLGVSAILGVAAVWPSKRPARGMADMAHQLAGRVAFAGLSAAIATEVWTGQGLLALLHIDTNVQVRRQPLAPSLPPSLPLDLRPESSPAIKHQSIPPLALPFPLLRSTRPRRCWPRCCCWCSPSPSRTAAPRRPALLLPPLPAGCLGAHARGTHM